MPIYEYQCQQCGHELERIQKMSDEPLKDCPACEKPELRRLISAAAFRLKGGGWYETDFKQGDKRNIADSGNDAPKSSEDSSKSATSTESGKSESAKSDSGSSGKTDAGSKSSSNKTSKPAKESKNSST
jgi:putative FmdB family regulatory protein